MNNDSLIDQARHLYAVLLITRYTAPIESNTRIERLNNLIILSYSRYVRRLNRCVVCYQYRSHDCNREPGKDHTPCQRRHSLDQYRQG